MCLEDVKIGRLTTGRLIARTVGTAPTQLIGQSNFRRVIILYPDPTTAYTVRFSDESGDAAFFTVFPTNGPIEMNRDKHGDIVGRALFANVAASTLSVVFYAADFHENQLKGYSENG